MATNSYKPIAKNRRSKYDYEISDTFIAGIVLSGPEAKSIRAGNVSLKGSFASFKSGELWVNNMHISQYPYAVYSSSYEPTQARKLLLSKSELAKIAAAKQNGKHLAVLSIGTGGRFIKLEIGTGNSKKKFDKRNQIKARTQQREAEKSMRTGSKS
jgi:SsrA-binding protein